MAFVLYDSAGRSSLFPLTYTRATADIRIGILTLKEWWEKLLGEEVYLRTEDYLANLYKPIPDGDHIYIDGAVLPSKEVVEWVTALKPGEIIGDKADPLAYHSHPGTSVKSIAGIRRLKFPWQIFQWNDEVMRDQFKLFADRKLGIQTAESTHVINAGDVFIEEGAVIEHSVLNASTGPIYIGKGVTIMEGCFVRGPFAAGEGTVVKMGTRIYGATTAGPHCVLGGEIRSSVLLGYSNKAHDGYLGHSVIGEWCNLGAGTSNSNLKNTAGDISMWDFERQHTEWVGNKCGVIMGDYTRTAINSSINTGSMFGIASNVFGEYLLPRLIPNFSWGSGGACSYVLEKALKDIRNWKNLKGKTVSPAEEKMIAYIFEHSKV